MTTSYLELANAAVRSLKPYQPGKPISEVERELGITHAIKLASNENPLGASQHVHLAIQNALADIHIYPDGSSFTLKNTLAQHYHIQPNQITLGNGSDNIIELIIKTFLSNTDTAIISQYAFLTISLLIQAIGAKAIVVPAKDYGHDPVAMVEAIQPNTRLFFLVNPNNPTGTHINADDFKKMMQAIPPHIVVVVDEAYFEYVTLPNFPDTLALLADHPNLIILRTFSKAYGLAGLRLGYAISSPDIADLLNRVRLPFNVNLLANAAGIAAIKDQAHIQKSRDLNTAGLAQLSDGLNALKLNYIPSAANFITVNVGDGEAVYQKLLRLGVIVRPLVPYHLPAHVRISTSHLSDNERCLKALKDVLALKEPLCQPS